jgi:hypothetical protein
MTALVAHAVVGVVVAGAHRARAVDDADVPDHVPSPPERSDPRGPDRGEVMSGQLAAVEHRLLAVPPPDQPASIATDVTIRWDPDVFFRLTLHPGELVAVIRIDR